MAKAADRKEIFERMPVPKALAVMAVPTVISQLVNLLYNIVDSIYIGRTGNSYMVAAVSLSFTLFVMTVSFFGSQVSAASKLLRGGRRQSHRAAVRQRKRE